MSQYKTGDGKKFQDEQSALNHCSQVFNKTGVVISMVKIQPKIRIYDNGGKTFDRYTVIYPRESYTRGTYTGHYYPFVGMSENPYHPQGFGQHGELDPPGRNGFKHLGQKITFDDLPEQCQRLVMSDLRELEK